MKRVENHCTVLSIYTMLHKAFRNTYENTEIKLMGSSERTAIVIHVLLNMEKLSEWPYHARASKCQEPNTLPGSQDPQNLTFTRLLTFVFFKQQIYRKLLCINNGCFFTVLSHCLSPSPTIQTSNIKGNKMAVCGKKTYPGLPAFRGSVQPCLVFPRLLFEWDLCVIQIWSHTRVPV